MSDEESSDSSLIKNEKKDDSTTPTWESLGLLEELCRACHEMNWKTPTPIQVQAIPTVLNGQDVIGIAETGSGKTGAFMLPIIQALLKEKQHFFALILTPTRELAVQICGEFKTLTSIMGYKINSVTLLGGQLMIEQSLTFASKKEKPHIIIATPGRLVDHLENTNGFNLRSIKFLVMDEADKILNMDFEIEVDKILRALPRERHNLLFSATMTEKVKKLQRAALKNPVKLEVSSKYKTVKNLEQSYLLIPAHLKDFYLVHVLNKLAGNSFIIFCALCSTTIRVALILRHLGFMAVPLNGRMSQSKRSTVLDKYKAKKRSILVSTDVASLGLDISHVGVVINYDIPTASKAYVHRVGRTARAGRSGTSITFVTQFDVKLLTDIEQAICKKLSEYVVNEDEVMLLQERVSDAQRTVNMELNKFKDSNKLGKRKKSQIDDDDDDDTEQSSGIRKRIGKNLNKDNKKSNRKIR